MLGGSLSYGTDATQASGIGDYTVWANGLTSSNYDIFYISDGLTITPRPLTVTADTQTKTYGDPDPTLTYTVDGLGLANGDTEATAFTGGLTRAAGEHVVGSPYAITQGTLAADSDYSLTAFNPVAATITARGITVTADDQTKTYGDPDPTLTYTVDGLGLANGDTEATAFTGGLTRAAGEHVVGSPYAITQGTLAADSDYSLTAFNGNALTITARASRSPPPIRPRPTAIRTRR